MHSLEARVFQAGRSLNLVYLDCPVSFPGDLDSASRLHPLYIYVQVSRPTVSTLFFGCAIYYNGCTSGSAEASSPNNNKFKGEGDHVRWCRSTIEERSK